MHPGAILVGHARDGARDRRAAQAQLRGDPVLPPRPVGGQLRLEVETVRIKGDTIKVRGSGSVAGRPVCEAELMFTMLEA